MTFLRKSLFALSAAILLITSVNSAFAQFDQGTITGVVEDTTGAAIVGATVTLKSLDMGQILTTKTDNSGIYSFPPVRIGNYEVTASAPSFVTTTQTNLHLGIQQRMNVAITLTPGAATQTVTVTSELPLMQTQDSSVGQTMTSTQINSVPLNGRNWVFIAQLAAGAVPPEGSRGQGKGDFNANGQRAEENNFILDGVDNNANVVDFYNGASFVAQPPPDALAEFRVQTSNYSAEFGHSAGAVVNASLKSGTNSFHGSLWEYVRNTVFDIRSWNDPVNQPVPGYHENQFGATLGGPFLKNRLFFFGDAQANRISFKETGIYSVPTALERAGDFSELLNTGLSGTAPTQLYYQTPNAPPVPFASNCMVTGTTCTSSVPGLTLNKTALAVLSYYPMPNTNGGKLYSNYIALRPVTDNTFQWDARLDWTIGAKDTTYSRYSYWNEMGYNSPPLGNILDGGGFGDDGNQKIYGANYMWSETHVFTPTFTNEARFGFNYLHTGFQHPNANNLGFADSIGFGGIPKAPLNGGLPWVSFSGNAALSSFGSPQWSTTDEHENVFQILDNVTKIIGGHSLKAGVNFQNIRFSTLQPQNSRGNYNYTGANTSNLNAANTGSGMADFLLDMQNNAGLSNEITTGDQRGDYAVYFQDDWRATHSLTINLGLRWELFQPYKEVGGHQASFNFTGPKKLDTTTGRGSSSAQYLIPTKSKAYAEPIMTRFGFDQVLAKDNISTVYSSDLRLIKTQHKNFAPRIGFAWSTDNKTVWRGGFGIFFGGLESLGYWGNLSENYPFQFTGSFPSNSCGTYNCPTDGITIGNGFSTIIANGFASNVQNLNLRGSDPKAKTPYTEDWNLSIERSITNDMVATIGYVGNTSRHLQINIDPNTSLALENPSNSIQNARPLPDFGGSAYTGYSGVSSYNALQTKLEKRMSHGYNLLATYTWSHALDDAVTPLGSTGDGNYRQTNLIPFHYDYSQAAFDTRQRFTFNALYELPFGKGRAYLNQNRATDLVAGGWSANATFVAQTGNFFTVWPSGASTASGFENGPFAYRVRDQFASGGSGANCASSTRNRTHWFNPCAFQNPWSANDPIHEPQHYIPKSASDTTLPSYAMPVYVTSLPTVLGYAGGRRDIALGPGYERVNMSLFKDFNVYREQKLTFRADIFNLFNTPSLGQPANMNNSAGGGNITGPRNLQKYAPDSRFFQLSLRYAF